VALSVVVEGGAARAIRRLDRDVRRLVVARLERLAENPRPPGSKKLEGAEDLHRVRVGDYRIVYRIEDEVLLVLAVRAAHRSDGARTRQRRQPSAMTDQGVEWLFPIQPDGSSSGAVRPQRGGGTATRPSAQATTFTAVFRASR
jgi:mRNA interferase RelE/StbE